MGDANIIQFLSQSKMETKSAHLAPPYVGHVAQPPDAVHADHVVVVHLSSQEIVHDLLRQRNIFLSKGAHKL